MADGLLFWFHIIKELKLQGRKLQNVFLSGA